MERETIFVEGDRATTAVESSRFINSGGSSAGTETPISITSGGSRSGHVLESMQGMRELIPLERNNAPHLEDFVRLGSSKQGGALWGTEGWTNVEREKFW